jgi:hypothetical protein
MKMRMKYLVWLGILPFLLNCWGKQDHEITRPVVPHYVFNGTAVDYDSGENLANIVIKLIATKMLYDVEFETQIDTTDSSGNFSFDSVYPGYYTWSIQKDSYWLAKNKLQIQHQDSTTIIKVPQLFPAQEFEHLYSSHPALAINGNNAWCHEYWRAGDIPPFINSDLIRVYKQRNKIWFFENYYISPFYHRNLTSMAFGREALYACVAPDTLYLVSLVDGKITGKYKLNQNITGVAYNPLQNCIYTCSKNNIYRHETEQPANIVQSWNYSGSNLSTIAYYKGIYTYDNNEYLLRKYDADMNNVTTFALINSFSKKQFLNIYDMSFDGYGELWVSLP